MSLKKFSFILLAFFSSNSFAMQEPNNEQTNDQQSQEQAAQQTTEKTLQDDFKHLDKKEELNKYNLIPIFKKYLEQCFDNLSFEELKKILCLIDKLYQTSSTKCTKLQSALPMTSKERFNSSYLCYVIFIILDPRIPLEVKLRQELLAIVENKRIQIKDKLASLSKDNKSARHKLKFDHRWCWYSTSKVKKLADNGYAPAISAILSHLSGGLPLSPEIPLYLEKLIQQDALDYIVDPLYDILISQDTYYYVYPEFRAGAQAILKSNSFCELLNTLTIKLTNENRYKPEYDPLLATIYMHLNDHNAAKKYAEKYLKANEGICAPSLLSILSNIYKQEGNTEKATFYSNQLE